MLDDRSTEEARRASYIVGPVWKAMKVLEFVAESGRGVSLTEVSTALCLPKTTVFRYLQTLSAFSFLQHDVVKDRYALGMRFRALALADLTLHRLREAAVPVMRDLVREYNETINLAVEADGTMVYVEVAESSRPLRIQARVGSREPLHTTALGKAFLAFSDERQRGATLGGALSPKTLRTVRDARTLAKQLESIRVAGVAVETGENEDGAVCIGVPVLNDLSLPIAALSLSAPEKRSSPTLVERASRSLIEAGHEIARRLRFGTAD